MSMNRRSILIAALVALCPMTALAEQAGTGSILKACYECDVDLFTVSASEVDPFPFGSYHGSQPIPTSGCILCTDGSPAKNGRTLGWSFVTAQAAPAAQTPPTDQEVAAVMKDLCGEDKRVGMGPLNNRNPDVGRYKPEWRARCEPIEAEHAKRGLAAKAKQQEDLRRLDAIITRIPGAAK